MNVLISKSIVERHIAAAPRPGLGADSPICLYLDASHLQADNFRRMEILVIFNYPIPIILLPDNCPSVGDEKSLDLSLAFDNCRLPITPLTLI